MTRYLLGCVVVCGLVFAVSGEASACNGRGGGGAASRSMASVGASSGATSMNPYAMANYAAMQQQSIQVMQAYQQRLYAATMAEAQRREELKQKRLEEGKAKRAEILSERERKRQQNLEILNASKQNQETDSSTAQSGSFSSARK